MIGLQEFEDIVDAEHLRRYLHKGAPEVSTSNKICIYHDGAQWVTVATDERAEVIDTTRKAFDGQADALQDALDALRFERDITEYRP